VAPLNHALRVDLTQEAKVPALRPRRSGEIVGVSAVVGQGIADLGDIFG
jgi:hypothetical protein